MPYTTQINSRNKNMKRKPKKQSDSVVKEDAVRVGLAIRRIRRERHMKQAELAALVDMQPAQLCNSEKGNNLPSLRTLGRICEALGVTVNDLMYSRNFVDENLRTSSAALISDTAQPTMSEQTVGEQSLAYKVRPADKLYEPLATRGIVRCTSGDYDDAPLNEQVVSMLQERITDYMALENMCGGDKHATIPLKMPFAIDGNGAEQLASLVRMHCGIASASVLDYVEMLENNGLRILFANLPEKLEGLSFFDALNTNAFILIAQDISPERQLFKVMVELANVYLYTKNGNTIVQATDANRNFANRFATVMLMPREAVQITLVQLGIHPEQWTFELLLRIKAHFGVSAEAFACRLSELSLLPKDGALLDSILKQSKKGVGEPAGESRRLSRNTRFNDLILCAKLSPENAREMKKIEARVKKDYPLNTEIKITPPKARPAPRKTGKRGRPKLSV